MKYLLIITLAVFFISWGFKPHKTINENAIYLLKGDLYRFYKKHAVYIREHAVDADIRKFTDHSEVIEHYIDIDAYEKTIPLDSINLTYAVAIEEFSLDTLEANGVLPWTIQKTYQLLKGAFFDKNEKNILRYSADLGHYVADAHVPLHTCKNYNGQLSHQHGIHSLWETQVPNLFIDTLIQKGTVEYVSHIDSLVWKIIGKSFLESNNVLSVDKELRMLSDFQNTTTSKIRFTQEYCKKYNEKLSLKTEYLFRCSSQCIANLWYTAWIEAGQPKLNYEDD